MLGQILVEVTRKFSLLKNGFSKKNIQGMSPKRFYALPLSVGTF